MFKCSFFHSARWLRKWVREFLGGHFIFLSSPSIFDCLSLGEWSPRLLLSTLCVRERENKKAPRSPRVPNRAISRLFSIPDRKVTGPIFWSLANCIYFRAKLTVNRLETSNRNSFNLNRVLKTGSALWRFSLWDWAKHASMTAKMRLCLSFHGLFHSFIYVSRTKPANEGFSIVKSLRAYFYFLSPSPNDR